MLDQHAQRFEEYAALPSGEKEAFFETTSIGAGKDAALAAKFFRPVANDASVNVWVDKAFVEGIIGNMLFDPDDNDIFTKERLMSVIKLQEQLTVDVNDCVGGDKGEEHYVATVASTVQSRAFSIALLDGGNKSDTSYLDVRICVVSARGTILSNLHLLPIPMRERHTGEHMFNLTSTALDHLVPHWRSRIISVTTDRASSMTGQNRGVASRLGNVALPGFYQVWCALHRLDLALQQLYNALCHDLFVGTETSHTI
jgi:hypothetical protein